MTLLPLKIAHDAPNTGHVLPRPWGPKSRPCVRDRVLRQHRPAAPPRPRAPSRIPWRWSRSAITGSSSTSALRRAHFASRPETGSSRQAGDIDVIPSGAIGGFVAETPYKSLQIRLAPRMLDHAASRSGQLASARLAHHHMLRNDRIILLGQALESDVKAGSPSGPLFAENVGMALAVELLSLTNDPPAQAARLSNEQLQRVLAYIDANLDRPLTIDILCREAGVSSSHLRTWFKAAMDVTIHRYILRRRVEHARLLLLQGDRKLSDIALEAGFSHQSHLAKWMRRELGYSPSQLRRSRN
ncbi:helix-turn-helix transcriptional regulator [Bradyrhizobium sp. SEMIA]|uniref:helix-turn-helix transcriptional regulator n=1 Tax=Bradyrhizobium sp. SEMIA TaxID=2597515 RepID=UPI00223F6024|nr:AraC family transcriptional regulator [Bradyrhizobium sp. SEMIA]